MRCSTLGLGVLFPVQNAPGMEHLPPCVWRCSHMLQRSLFPAPGFHLEKLSLGLPVQRGRMLSHILGSGLFLHWENVCVGSARVSILLVAHCVHRWEQGPVSFQFQCVCVRSCMNEGVQVPVRALCPHLTIFHTFLISCLTLPLKATSGILCLWSCAYWCANFDKDPAAVNTL